MTYWILRSVILHRLANLSLMGTYPLKLQRYGAHHFNLMAHRNPQVRRKTHKIQRDFSRVL